MRTVSSTAALVVAALAVAPDAAHANELFVQAGGNLSALTTWSDGNITPTTVGYGGRVGWQFGEDYRLFLELEHNIWPGSGLSNDGLDSVLNAGVGGALLFFDGHGTSAIAIGASTLLFETSIDSFGTTGLYVDLRPAGVRMPVWDAYVLELHPLSLAVMAPATDGIPLVRIIFRSGLTVGRSF